ncbi:MAG TPA: hypothetical protein VLW46_00260 [Candidatus Bathyarchaeia archaeon]|nr:hypothetical protein [Candidatus Bathyarchaeia archaeon]
MRRQNSLCLAFALLFAAPFLAPTASAQTQDTQSQTDSVADAARKARAQKKPADKPAPVITDDILKPSNATAKSQDQSAAPAASDSTAAPGANSSTAGQEKSQGAETSEDKDKLNAELASLKEQVAEAQKAVDLAKRELALEQDNLYSKTDYQTDTAGKSKVAGLTQQVTDKQQLLDDLKTKLEELQSKAPAPETPPSTPPQL